MANHRPDDRRGTRHRRGRGSDSCPGTACGPKAVVDGKEVVDYPEFAHTDYLETVENFTAALTGKVDHEEYIARVLAMAQVYWALGIRWAAFGEKYGIAEALDRFQAAKAEWTVLSFRALGEAADDELTEAETQQASVSRAIRAIASTSFSGTRWRPRRRMCVASWWGSRSRLSPTPT